MRSFAPLRMTFYGLVRRLGGKQRRFEYKFRIIEKLNRNASASLPP
jgi:hypothetical protein